MKNERNWKRLSALWLSAALCCAEVGCATSTGPQGADALQSGVTYFDRGHNISPGYRTIFFMPDTGHLFIQLDSLFAPGSPDGVVSVRVFYPPEVRPGDSLITAHGSLDLHYAVLPSTTQYPIHIAFNDLEVKAAVVNDAVDGIVIQADTTTSFHAVRR